MIGRWAFDAAGALDPEMCDAVTSECQVGAAPSQSGKQLRMTARGLFRVPFGVPPSGSGTDEKLEVEPLQLGKRALPYRPCP